MTVKRKILITAATVAMVGVMAACTNPDPTPSTSTSPSTSSSSSTSSTTTTTTSVATLSPAEKDIKDAEQAIPRLRAVLDKLGAGPQLSLNEIATVARDQAFAQWQSNLTTYRRQGWKQIGTSTVVSSRAKVVDDSKIFSVTACIDVSKLNMVDQAGKSVITAGRPDRSQYTYKVEKAPQGFFVTQDTLKGEPC